MNPVLLNRSPQPTNERTDGRAACFSICLESRSAFENYSFERNFVNASINHLRIDDGLSERYINCTHARIRVPLEYRL